VAARLTAQGLDNPRVEGEVQPYSINHNVTRGEWATRDCQACHRDDAALNQPMQLAGFTPGGVTPSFVNDANIANSGDIVQGEDGALYFQPAPEQAGVYIFGSNRISWIDWLGLGIFLLTLGAVGLHGGLRFYMALRNPRPKPELKRVYMYDVYERFWHWLQTVAIILLIFTGLVIHRPDMLGMFNFRYMVWLHNMLALILLVNAAMSLFYHLTSGAIRQFIPRPYGFFDQAILQAQILPAQHLQGRSTPDGEDEGSEAQPVAAIDLFLAAQRVAAASDRHGSVDVGGAAVAGGGRHGGRVAVAGADSHAGGLALCHLHRGARLSDDDRPRRVDRHQGDDHRLGRCGSARTCGRAPGTCIGCRLHICTRRRSKSDIT
jgi:hypothetical protein